MTEKDLYVVGARLLGLYFAVFGATSLCTVLFHVIRSFRMSSLSLLIAPAVYVGAAVLLIKKTSWCLSLVGIKTEEETSEHLPGA